MGEVVPGQDGEYRHHGEVVFLYPDLVTALAGQWVEGRLARGRQVRVAGLRWAGGVAQLVTRPAPGAAVVSYQPAGSLCISRSPLVRDPYEVSAASRPPSPPPGQVRHVYVAPSRASEAAGEGLFAKTALGPGCLVALFNGVRQRVVAGTRDTRAWSDYRWPPHPHLMWCHVPLCQDRVRARHRPGHPARPGAGGRVLRHPRPQGQQLLRQQLQIRSVLAPEVTACYRRLHKYKLNCCPGSGTS